MLEKIKPFQNDIILALVIVLVSLASFGLGRLSEIRSQKTPIAITSGTIGEGRINENPPKKYVGSRNGTRYHLPWCSGAQRITEANKVWFKSAEEAKAAGYSPSSNCKGM